MDIIDHLPVSEQQVVRWILNFLYEVPRDTPETEKQFNRRLHFDLSHLTPAGLAAEERRVELRGLLDPAPPAWLGERLTAIRDERRRRGR